MDELWQPVPLPEEPPPPPRRRGGRGLAIVGWVTRVVEVALLVAIGAFFFFTRTDRGATLVLDQVFRRLPLHGRITAAASRSDDLLEGVRLYGVTIAEDDGRPLATIDSLRVGYNWRALLSGDVLIDTLEVWSPSVTIARYPGEAEFNVERIFVSEDQAADSTQAPPGDLIVRGVAIRGGEARVLYPAGPDPSPRWITEPAPSGDSLLRSQTFAGIDGRLPLILLQSRDTVGQRVRVDSLSFVGEIVADPVRVRDLRGSFRYRDARIDGEVERVALDGSEASGTVFMELPGGTEPVRVGFDLDTPGLDFADLAWMDERIGEGRAVGGVALDARGEDARIALRRLQITARGSRVRLDGGVAIEGGRLRVDGLEVRATPLALARVEPWLDTPLPVRGEVEGDARLDGTLGELSARGRVALRRGGDAPPVTAEFSGGLDLEGELGFSDFHATLDPFDFGLVSLVVPGVKLTGAGSATVDATGRASGGIAVRAAVHHRPSGADASDVFLEGTVRRGREWELDVQASAQPLSLTALARDYPDLPVTGDVTGVVTARGPLSDLTLVTDVATEAGRLAITARFDATDPGRHYAVQGEVGAFALSKLVPSLPAPTVLSGFIDLQGRGTEAATLALDARARLRPSRVGGLFVDTVGLALRVADGRFTLDTLDAVLGGIAVRAEGTLGMVAGTDPGRIGVTFRSDSLGRLRPLVLGDVVIARDTLTALDRELLRAEGIDPDTLATQADVTVEGSVRGRAALTGSIDDFAVDGEVTFERARWGRSLVRGAEVTFHGAGLPGTDGAFALDLDADSVTALDRRFAHARLALSFTRPEGRFDLALDRGVQEGYQASGSFQARDSAATVRLDRMELRFDSTTWALDRPASFAWSPGEASVRDFVLVGPADSLRVAASGTVPRDGPVDFTLDARGVPLDRVARLLQREDLDVTGRVAVTARVTGTAEAPLVLGGVDARDLDLQTYSMSRLAGQIDYADQTLRLSMGAWQDSLRVLTASGLVPVDLALRARDQRVPTDRQMDLTVNADSLPAAFALGYATALTQVGGSISGQFHIVGTIDQPSPSGTVALNDATWTIEDLGVRHRDVRGTLGLRPDGTVDVQIRGTSGGALVATGTVALQPLTNPTFDLRFTGGSFLAARRPDVEATMTGVVALTGTYNRPVLRTIENVPIRVDESVLYVEEFQRTVAVIDLSDPSFFAVVDTTGVSGRPLVEASANPFLRNLRVDVALTAQGNSWLRSREMNVEMGGALQVVYDRQTGDLVTVGTLQAIRGTYNVFGRSFQVESGTVEFLGTPGINPTLNIVASTRVRQGGGTGGGENIEIQATVGGTLLGPRVALSSPESDIAQSDLVSYLIFGVPGYQLGAGQQAQVQGQSQLLSNPVVGAGFSYLQGTLVSQLGSLVTQELGFFDYFAISTPEQLVNLGSVNFTGTLLSTTFEVGFYLEEDVFATLLFAPLAGRNGTGTNPFGGARLDWSLGSGLTLQAFYEDRYLRQPTLGFDQQILKSSKVGGLFLFRDWGYNGGGR